MSALTELFPEITTSVCRSYLQQARATPNDVSAQIKAVVLSREQMGPSGQGQRGPARWFPWLCGSGRGDGEASLRTKRRRPSYFNQDES